MERTLLIICDDWEALDVYERELASVFHHLVCSPLAHHGLDHLLEQKVDALFVDLALPDVTLDEFCQTLLARGVKLPGVSVCVTEQNKPTPAPFSGSLSRPFQYTDLRSKLRV